MLLMTRIRIWNKGVGQEDMGHKVVMGNTTD